jgi:hypothetical protein
MLILFKATALIMFGTFVIGMGIAFITNSLGTIFIKLSAQKEKKKNKV